MLPKEIEKEVWQEAIKRYEKEVMILSVSTIQGDIKPDESVLEYATRTRALQREAMDKLEYALWRATAEIGEPPDFNIDEITSTHPHPTQIEGCSPTSPGADTDPPHKP